MISCQPFSLKVTMTLFFTGFYQIRFIISKKGSLLLNNIETASGQRRVVATFGENWLTTCHFKPPSPYFKVIFVDIPISTANGLSNLL